MRKTIVLAILGLSVMLFSQCAKKGTAVSSAAAAEEVAEMKKKYTPEQMVEGKAVYVGSCQKCHKLYQPDEFTVKAWHKILPEMCQKAELNPTQAALVRAWVISNARTS